MGRRTEELLEASQSSEPKENRKHFLKPTIGFEGIENQIKIWQENVSVDTFL
jgi:hypothetical protein